MIIAGITGEWLDDEHTILAYLAAAAAADDDDEDDDDEGSHTLGWNNLHIDDCIAFGTLAPA